MEQKGRWRQGCQSDTAHCQNITAPTSHQYGYRLRVGHHRVLFDWDGMIRIVEIQEIKTRNERTY
jgi:mRNA-degrading endonuclease RelE of RelBE toxin-antitoxin system